MSFILVDFPVSEHATRQRPRSIGPRIASGVLISAIIAVLLTSVFALECSTTIRNLFLLFSVSFFLLTLTCVTIILRSDNSDQMNFRIDSKGIQTRQNGRTLRHRWRDITNARIVEATLPGESFAQRRLQLKKRATLFRAESTYILPLSGQMLENLAPVIKTGIEQWGLRWPQGQEADVQVTWIRPALNYQT